MSYKRNRNTPQKVIDSVKWSKGDGSVFYIEAKCPACHRIMCSRWVGEFNFCGSCGQRLDWSEVENDLFEDDGPYNPFKASVEGKEND